MKNPITLSNVTSQGKEIKTIFEIEEKELPNFRFLGQGCGINVGHVLFIGSKHSHNLRADVVAYQIVKSKHTEWLENGMKKIGRNDKYISVKFYGLKIDVFRSIW